MFWCARPRLRGVLVNGSLHKLESSGPVTEGVWTEAMSSFPEKDLPERAWMAEKLANATALVSKAGDNRTTGTASYGLPRLAGPRSWVMWHT